MFGGAIVVLWFYARMIILWPWWWSSLSPVFRRISQSDFAEECIVLVALRLHQKLHRDNLMHWLNWRLSSRSCFLSRKNATSLKCRQMLLICFSHYFCEIYLILENIFFNDFLYSKNFWDVWYFFSAANERGQVYQDLPWTDYFSLAQLLHWICCYCRYGAQKLVYFWFTRVWVHQFFSNSINFYLHSSTSIQIIIICTLALCGWTWSEQSTRLNWNAYLIILDFQLVNNASF